MKAIKTRVREAFRRKVRHDAFHKVILTSIISMPDLWLPAETLKKEHVEEEPYGFSTKVRHEAFHKVITASIISMPGAKSGTTASTR